MGACKHVAGTPVHAGDIVQGDYGQHIVLHDHVLPAQHYAKGISTPNVRWHDPEKPRAIVPKGAHHVDMTTGQALPAGLHPAGASVKDRNVDVRWISDEQHEANKQAQLTPNHANVQEVRPASHFQRVATLMGMPQANIDALAVTPNHQLNAEQVLLKQMIHDEGLSSDYK